MTLVQQLLSVQGEAPKENSQFTLVDLAALIHWGGNDDELPAEMHQGRMAL